MKFESDERNCSERLPLRMCKLCKLFFRNLREFWWWGEEEGNINNFFSRAFGFFLLIIRNIFCWMSGVSELIFVALRKIKAYMNLWVTFEDKFLNIFVIMVEIKVDLNFGTQHTLSSSSGFWYLKIYFEFYIQIGYYTS